MRFIIVAFSLFLSVLAASSKEVRDTVWTRQNDKIILTYNVTVDGDQFVIDFSTPRVVPSPSSPLKKSCRGELDKLKVVVFGRIGDFSNVNWKGLTPTAFMVPKGLSYDETPEGYYILGESQPIEFHKSTENNANINLPLYIAVYEKKRNYRIVSMGRQPLKVSSAVDTGKASGKRRNVRQRTETEMIAVTSSVELEADNDDVTSALSSIAMVKELLARETEVPFSQTLQMEITSLRLLKNQIKEPEIINKINDVMLLYSDKERELKEAQNESALAAKAQEQALLKQQEQEAEAQQKAAEEKAREQEEKQQKRTLWMIIGGVILAIIGFIGNAVFNHFRDIRNQKSIMQMQESLARQAQHEAGRRTREIIRNKAHRAANKGRNKLRESLKGTDKQIKNTKRRSI